MSALEGVEGIMIELYDAALDLIKTDPKGVLPDVGGGAERPIEEGVPNSISYTPTLVLGFPEIETNFEAMSLLKVELQIFVIGTRVDAGETQRELIMYADQVFQLFGGGSSVRHLDVPFSATSCRPRQLSIGELTFNTYAIAVEADLSLGNI